MSNATAQITPADLVAMTTDELRAYHAQVRDEWIENTTEPIEARMKLVEALVRDRGEKMLAPRA